MLKITITSTVNHFNDPPKLTKFMPPPSKRSNPGSAPLNSGIAEFIYSLLREELSQYMYINLRQLNNVGDEVKLNNTIYLILVPKTDTNVCFICVYLV